ncbi:flagellar motor protein MotD [Rhodanobacter sp. Root480]|uniref:Flagellar motor protein MotD n=1 Tax=Rhodanobacter ginsenosidimutans TaxID=490571 RepID=A0ABW0JZ35_9GAMM|nr:flagellar motor protein MotD [Rhodanobacter sp. Root480]
MRRKHHEEHMNHEAWAIPYADLMTLLLAFFVVMYAVSVVNEGKYRVMSESIVEAFNGSSHVIAPMPSTKVRPHNIQPAIAAPAGQPGSSIVPIAVPIPPHPVPMHGEGRGAHAGFKQATAQENLKDIAEQVQKALQPLIDKQQVVLRRTEDWLEIEIRTDILFPSGVAELAPSASAILRSLSGILAPFANPLRVEGYTDDVPIRTMLYPSNWELSAARAATVARLFSEHGVNPDRLGIIGWGEVRPAADNSTPEGRNLNRRVLVVVLSDHNAPSRFYTDSPKLEAAHADEPSVVMAASAIPGELPTARVTAASDAAADGEVPAAQAAGPTLRQVVVATAVETPSAGGAADTVVPAPTAAGVRVPTASAAPMGGAPRRNPPAAPLH